MNRRSLLIRAGALAGAVGGGWWLKDHVLWRPPGMRFLNGERTPWIGFAAEGINPIVPVRLADRLVNALIDSGAQYSVIDRAFFEGLADVLGPAPMFDIPMVAYGVGGRPQMGRGVRLDLGLEGLQLQGLRCAMLNLGPIADVQGLSAPLILGQDVLRHLVLEVDAERRSVRLGERHGAVEGDLRRLAVRRKGTALLVPVEIEGRALEAVVDTGASSVLSLSRSSAEQAGLMDGRPAETGESLVLGGRIEARVVTATHVTAAGRDFRDVPVAVYGAVGLPGTPTALLGMGAFRGGRLVMDIGGAGLWRSQAVDLGM